MTLSYDYALIIGSGESVPAHLPGMAGNPLIICADGGGDWAYHFRLVPHLIIGDMDSISPKAKDHWQLRQIEFVTYPEAKDKTDVELAIDYAIDQGITRFLLVGAWGSRIDHSLANYELLYNLAKQGYYCQMETESARLIATDRDLSFETFCGAVISLLPMSDEVRGVTTTGVAFPLANATLFRGSTRSVSNKARQNRIEVKIGEGILLVVSETRA